MPLRLLAGSDQQPQRLDRFVAERLDDTSRATVQRWIAERRITLNGRVARSRDPVHSGDVVEVEPGPPQPSLAQPDPAVPIDALFEDDEIIVVNKPAGLVVHPGRGHWTGTLVNGLLAHARFAPDAADPDDAEGPSRPGIVHRIDKETSGVLVVAKTGRAREHLKQQLGEHSVERVYWALTNGCPVTQRIETLHARHPRSRLRFTSQTQRGRRAVTNIRVLERLVGGAAALVECRLETGRTHQIRVHLAERAGTPILADSLYGRAPSSVLTHAELGLERHALHAGVLGFVHPTRGDPLRFEVPLPADMQHALEEMRRLSSAG